MMKITAPAPAPTQSVDPNRVTSALMVIHGGFMAVVATLKLQFAMVRRVAFLSKVLSRG